MCLPRYFFLHLYFRFCSLASSSSFLAVSSSRYFSRRRAIHALATALYSFFITKIPRERCSVTLNFLYKSSARHYRTERESVGIHSPENFAHHTFRVWRRTRIYRGEKIPPCNKSDNRMLLKNTIYINFHSLVNKFSHTCMQFPSQIFSENVNTRMFLWSSRNITRPNLQIINYNCMFREWISESFVLLVYFPI